MHDFSNVVAQLRGALDTKDAAHDLHPKGGNRMELFKSGRFETAGKDLAIEAVEAKVVVLLALLGDADDLAAGGLGEVGKNSILARLEVAGGLQSTLGVDQMAVSEAKRLLRDAALGLDDDSMSRDNMRDGAFGMDTNLVKGVVFAGVGNHGVRVEAWG